MKTSDVDPEIVLFEGSDFHCSPLHEPDSDEIMSDLLFFLTLKPGDTDSEFFVDYTSEQLSFAILHGEALQIECIDRFGKR